MYGAYSYTKAAKEKNPDTNDVSRELDKMYAVHDREGTVKSKGRKKVGDTLGEASMHARNKAAYSKSKKGSKKKGY